MSDEVVKRCVTLFLVKIEWNETSNDCTHHSLCKLKSFTTDKSIFERYILKLTNSLKISIKN
jgi:hypothetical protein